MRTLVAVKHLPGRHHQQTHAGDAFVSASDAQKWLLKKYPKLGVDIASLDAEIASEVAREFDELATAYPQVSRRIKYLGFPRTAEEARATEGMWAISASEGLSWRKPSSSIVLNPVWWKKTIEFRASLRLGTSTGFHPSGTDTPAGIIAHEFGHHLHAYFDRKADITRWVSKNISHQSAVSEYAKKNAGEFFAEMFASTRHTPNTEQSPVVGRFSKVLPLYLTAAKKHKTITSWNKVDYGEDIYDDLPESLKHFSDSRVGKFLEADYPVVLWVVPGAKGFELRHMPGRHDQHSHGRSGISAKAMPEKLRQEAEKRLAATKHLAGQHDQSTHGRGGVGGLGEQVSQTGAATTASPTVVKPKEDIIREPFKTAKEAEEWLSSHYKKTKFNIDDMDSGTATSIAREYDHLAKQFPEVAKTIKYLGFPKTDQDVRDIASLSGTWAVTDSYFGRIVLSRGWFGASSKDKLSKSLVEGVQIGWHPKNTDSPSAVLAHEFGHLVDYHVRNRTDSDRWLIKNNMEAPTVSKYAMTNKREFFAEMFSSVQKSVSKDRVDVTNKFSRALSYFYKAAVKNKSDLRADVYDNLPNSLKIFEEMKHLPGQHAQQTHAGTSGSAVDLESLIPKSPAGVYNGKNENDQDPDRWLREEAEKAGQVVTRQVWSSTHKEFGHKGEPGADEWGSIKAPGWIIKTESPYWSYHQRREALDPPANHVVGAVNPKLLAEVDARTLASHALMAEATGMGLQEYRQATAAKAKELVDSALKTGGVFTRVSPSTLEAVLSSGEFKTTYDTNKRGVGGIGAKGPKAFGEYLDDRKDQERMYFGYPGSKPQKKQSWSEYFDLEAQNPRPLYGYLSADSRGRIDKKTLEGKKSDRWLDQYGSVAIQFKSSVHERTTITHGDSLDQTRYGYTAPVSLRNPTHHFERIGFTPDGSNTIAEARKSAKEQAKRGILKAKAIDDDDILNAVRQWGQAGYVEAQIHKRVNVSDISRVVFARKPPPALRKLLGDRKISWEVSE